MQRKIKCSCEIIKFVLLSGMIGLMVVFSSCSSNTSIETELASVSDDSISSVDLFENIFDVYGFIYGDFKFVYNTETSSLTITRYTGTDLIVQIPESVNGFPVTVIGTSAFAGSSIETVYIPNSITDISHLAFHNCMNLTNINIPSSVTNIGRNTFVGANNLDKMEIDSIIPGVIYRFGGINWNVLTVQDGRALLLSRNIIGFGTFHDTAEHTTWEQSSIRNFLNGEVFDSIFTEDEKALIIESRIPNPANVFARELIPGSQDTYDRLFLLSIDEITQFVDCRYCLSAVIETDRNEAWWWWLRTPGYGLSVVGIDYTGMVFADGYFFSKDGYIVGHTGGIRPALWMSLNSD